MLILKSTIVWNRLPSFEEIRSAVDATGDPTIGVTKENDPEYLSEYFKLTGLRIYYNGKDRYRSEYKYGYNGSKNEVYLPELTLPDPEDFILV